MVEVNREWMLVRFKGTYTTASRSGVRGAKVVLPFDLKVKMHKRFLEANGLRGAFDTYYKQAMKQHFPEMIDLDKFIMVEATELDGSKIDNPKCLSHDDTIAYIQEREYPINIGLYDSQDLRHQVVLYEKEKSLGYRDRHGVLQNGQQRIQSTVLQARGGHMQIANEIREMNSVWEIMDPTEEHHDEAIARQQLKDKKIQADKLHKSKAMPERSNPVTEAKKAAVKVAANVEEVDHNPDPAEESQASQSNEEESFSDLFGASDAS